MVVNGGDVSTASLPAPQLHVGLPAQITFSGAPTLTGLVKSECADG